MARRTKIITIGEHEITLARPVFMDFRRIAAKAEALMEVELQAAMTTTEFVDVIKACTIDADLDLDEMDYADAAKLWDEVITFCEFPAFFAERRRQHFERSKERVEIEVDLQAAQYNRMKKQGLLPENFSIESVLTESGLTNQTSSPSSPTTTPAGTDGDDETSSERTSGSSSATSPKRSAGAKRTSA